MLCDPGSHAGTGTLGPFDLILEGANLSLGTLLGGLKFTLGLSKAILKVALNLLVELVPLNRGRHQGHSLEKYIQKIAELV